MTKNVAVVKITKKDNYAELRECVLANADWFEEGVAERLVEFIDHEVELLSKRSGSKKPKESKAEDELSNAVRRVVEEAEEPMTITDVVKALQEQYPDATPQKVSYRLTQMVKNGILNKEIASIKNEDGKGSRRINVYSVACPESEAEAE